MACYTNGLLAQNSFTWTGGSGNWSDVAKWDCGGCGRFPGDNGITSDTVSINTVNIVTLDTAVTVGQLFFSGSTLACTKMLTIKDSMLWAGSTLSGQLTIDKDATLEIAAAGGSKTLTAMVHVKPAARVNQLYTFLVGSNSGIINDGIYNQISGKIHLNSATATVENNNQFNVAHDGEAISGASATVTNNGTFNKNGGGGTMSVVPNFINNGTINHTDGDHLTFYRLTNNGSLNLKTGATLETGSFCIINSPINIDTGQVLLLSSGDLTIDTTLVIDGTFESSGGASEINGTGKMIFNGVYNWLRGNIKIDVAVDSGGVLNRSGTGSTNLWDTITINTDGVFNQSSGLTINSIGRVINDGVYNKISGNLHLNGSTITFNNNGIFNVAHDGTVLSGGIGSAFINNGVFDADGGGGDMTVTNGFINNGSIRGEGSLFFNNLTQSGVIAPKGDSIGILKVHNVDNSGGVIEIQIKDNDGMGVGHDVLQLDGTTIVGGVLNVVLADTNFTPVIGDSYTVVQCLNGCNGSFDAVYVPTLDSAKWSVDYIGGNVVLTVIASPEEYYCYSLEVSRYFYTSLFCNLDCGNPWNTDDPTINLMMRYLDSSSVSINSATFYNEWSEECGHLPFSAEQTLVGCSSDDEGQFHILLDGWERDDGLICGGDDGDCRGFNYTAPFVVIPEDIDSIMCQDFFKVFRRECDDHDYEATIGFRSWYRYLKPGKVGLSKSIFDDKVDLYNHVALKTTTEERATPHSIFEWQVLIGSEWESTGITEENAELVIYLLENTGAIGNYTFRRKATNHSINCSETKIDYSNHITIYINDDCNEVFVSEEFPTNFISSPPFALGGTGSNVWTTDTIGANYSQYCVSEGYIGTPTSPVISYLETSFTITDSSQIVFLKFDMTYDLKGKCYVMVDGNLIEEFVGISNKWNSYIYELNLSNGAHTIRWEYRKDVTDNANENEAVRIDNINIHAAHPDLLPMLSLFHQTEGDIYWIDTTGWADTLNCDPCTWHGVTCDTLGRVTGLSLPNNGLTGILPWELSQLDKLDTLDLSGNQLVGGYPQSYQPFCCIYTDFTGNDSLPDFNDYCGNIFTARIRNATDTLVAGFAILSRDTIDTSADYTYMAGQSITLDSTFEAILGSVFTAIMISDPCDLPSSFGGKNDGTEKLNMKPSAIKEE